MCPEKPKRLIISKIRMEKVLKYEKLCPPSVLSLARGSINACLRYPGIWWFAFMLSLYALELALVPQVSSCCLEKVDLE